MKRYKKLSKDELINFLSRLGNAERRLTFEKRILNGITETELQFAENRISEVLDEMNAALNGRIWLNGPKLSLADIGIAPFIERLEANNVKRLVDWKKRPSLGSWWLRIQELPSYKTAFDFTMLA